MLYIEIYFATWEFAEYAQKDLVSVYSFKDLLLSQHIVSFLLLIFHVLKSFFFSSPFWQWRPFNFFGMLAERCFLCQFLLPYVWWSHYFWIYSPWVKIHRSLHNYMDKLTRSHQFGIQFKIKPLFCLTQICFLSQLENKMRQIMDCNSSSEF